MVYLKMQTHMEHVLGQGNPMKLASKWYGPFKIVQTVVDELTGYNSPPGPCFMTSLPCEQPQEAHRYRSSAQPTAALTHNH
jgi:hypothetical protein